MTVPAFVLPILLLFCAGLACPWFVRSCLRVIRARRKPGARDTMAPAGIGRRLLVALSGPLLLMSLCSFASLGSISCLVGLYTTVPAPLAPSVLLTTASASPNPFTPRHSFDGLVTYNARDGSVRWTQPMTATGEGSYAFTEVDDVIYLSGFGNKVNAYRASDGRPLWTTTLLPAPNSPPDEFLHYDNQPPVVGDSMVFVRIGRLLNSGLQDGSIEALRASTGSLAWSLPIHFTPITTDPLLVENAGLLFTLGQEGGLSAWHTSDGSAAWRSAASVPPDGEQQLWSVGLLAANQTVYTVQTTLLTSTAPAPTQAFVVAHRASDGQRLWKRAFPSPIEALGAPLAPMVRLGTHVYLRLGVSLYDLDAATGATLWQRVVGTTGVGTTEFSVALLEEHDVLYVPGLAAGSATLYAVSSRDGRQIWSHTLAASGGFTTLTITQQVIFASTWLYGPRGAGGQGCPGFSEPSAAIFAFNAGDGSIYWRIPTASTESDYLGLAGTE